MRLINAERYAEKIREYANVLRDENPASIVATMAAMSYDIAANEAMKEPTIDAVPVIHAHWLERYENIMCSHCKATYYDNIVDMYHDRVDYRRYVGLEHCPHCGALMSGDDENDEND